MPKDAMGVISDVMGPPKALGAPAAAPDPDESDEGGEGELETHLRAFNKATRSGDMRAAAESFKAAVNACGGGDYESPISKME